MRRDFYSSALVLPFGGLQASMLFGGWVALLVCAERGGM
jgi:hypothetical protein